MPPFLQRLLSRADAAPPSTDASTSPTLPTPGAHNGLVPEFLHEDEVTVSILLRLFRQAYLPVESRAGNRLMLTCESGVRMQVLVDAPRRLIALSASYALQPTATRADKLAFVNRVNDRVVFVRFSLADDDTLYVDHQLAYDGGVTAAAVIGCVRRLGRIAPQAIVEYAEPGLMR